MSWKEAPAWVRAADLSAWTASHALSWPAPVAGPAVASALTLREEIALALTFRSSRGLHIAAADEAVVCLRERLRLARQLGLLDEKQLRYAAGELAEIGAMLGGWQRRRRQRRPRQSQAREGSQGVDPAARTG